MNKLDMVVIHDLKNSLMNVALRLGSHAGLQNEVNSIMGASSKLTNLLLLNKYDKDEFDIQLDAQPPADIVALVSGNFHVMYPHITIESDLSASPEMWFYDTYYIELALNIGLHNASQFAQSKVKISAYEEDDFLVFKIEDDGPGFAESVLKSFNRRSPLSASERGTGLGITLADTIASRHIKKTVKGVVTIENENGAVFSIKLP